MKKNLVLLGMMGVGKSTLGRIVAKKQGFKFIDTDLKIEEKCSMKISDIFKKKGEAFFRQEEEKVVLESIEEINSIIASEYALGFDNLAYFYEKKDILIQEISNAYISHTKWPIKLSKPYVVKSSNLLLNKFPLIKRGITATAPGFYAPQGRKLRLSTSIKNLQQKHGL